MFEDEIEDKWNEMVDAGVLVAGEDEEYTFNLDKLKEYDLDLYKVYMAEVNGELLNMQMQGLVDIDFDDEDDWKITLTEKGERIAQAIEDLYRE